ncbi:MAG TPA: hypothetical protein VFF78_02305, partial [Anaerolineaceae bacterium]|nr:hypothetical protein [Anaerolineaceae bacterium]
MTGPTDTPSLQPRQSRPGGQRWGIEIWLVILILLAHVFLSLVPANSMLAGWYSSDDAFYYFKVAQNVVDGQGITFDGINRTNGFHPLWMLICLPVFAIAQGDLILPLRLIILISGTLTAFSSLLLFRLLKRWLPPALNALVMIFWAFYPYLHQSITRQGMETGLSSFFILLTLYLLSRLETNREQCGYPLRDVLGVGLSAALMVLSRLDNIFLAGFAGLWLLWRSPTWQNAPRPVRIFLPLDMFLVSAAIPFGILLRMGGIVGAYVLAIPVFIALEIILRLGINTAAGLYRAQKFSPRALILRTAIAALAGSLVTSSTMLAISKLVPAIQFPRSLPLIEAVVVFIGMVALRIWQIVSADKKQSGEEHFDTTQSSSKDAQWNTFFKTVAAYGIPLVLLIGGYMAFNYAYFGTLTPVSGQIKQWWGTLPVTVYGWATVPSVPLLRMFPVLISTAWSLIGGLWPGGLLVIAALLIFLWQRAWARSALIATGFWPLLAGVWLQVVYYQVIGYLHTRLWYWAGISLWLTLLFALTAGALCQRFSRQSRPTWQRISLWIGNGIAAALAVLVLGLWGVDIMRRMP